jgi:SAM-dependent methyltransferase
VAPATTWGAGAYARMAERLVPAAEAVADAADLQRGEAVIDVACGTGNGALAAAVRGAEPVLGVDLEPALLALAPQDAGVQWRVGDAAALPVPDGAFDVALSVFGVMYAADQPGAARELARVVAPGGRIALANWGPGSFLPATGAALAPFLPAGERAGFAAPPSRWGDPAPARELLAEAGFTQIAHRADALTLEFASRAAAVAFLVATAGDVVAERPRLEAEGRWPALLGALAGVVTRHDRGGEDGRVRLRCDYLITTARRPRTTPAPA